MIHLRARTLRRYGNGRVTPVGFVGIRDPAFEAGRGDRLPETKSISQGHKERIMAELIEHPAGLTTVSLAAVLGLGHARTYTLFSELSAQGLVDKLGVSRDASWIAQV